MSFLDIFRTELQKFVAALNERKEQLERARTRLKELQTLPLPMEEYLAEVDAWIDTKVTQHQKSLTRMVNEHAADIVAGRPLNFGAVLGGAGGIVIAQEITAVSVLSLLGPEIKTALRRVLKDIYPHKVGPSKTDRAKEMDALQKQIAKLELEIKEMNEEAYKAGVRL